MRKAFCDMCEDPAYSDIHKREILWALTGDQYPTKVCISLYASFRDHPTGFGGPPDLCKNCALKLIDAIKSDIEQANDDALGEKSKNTK